MKLAAIAKLIKADGYCKLYKVFYDDCRTYDLYIGTKTAIFPLTGFPKAQNESELATLLGISKKEWADIEFDNDCPDDLHHIEGMDLDDTADGEMDCVTGRIGIRYCGCELVPMIEPVSGTVGFVDAKQIMPVADEIRKSGYFKYCARKMASGGRYYVIKDGMVVRGAVLPVKLEPLAKSGLRELADMIVWTKNADGAWSYDYTVFDRWVELMTGLGIDHTINCYSMLPWNNELHYRDGVTGRFVDVTADPGTPAFEELWVPFLTDFTGHLREKGWLGRTNIAMDERSPEEMTDALDLLRKTAPELGIAMADNKNSYLSYPFINSMCVKVRDRVPPKHIAERRAQGFVTTYYVCCSDRFPNMFTFSDPAEAVYAGWYTAACGYDGFLRWAYNSWVGEPLTDSRFRTFPAGDTYIIYPGARSSVRFERLVEGIQDAEKISILKKEFAAAGTPEAASRLEQLETLLAGFASITPEAGWPDRLSQSKRTLNELSH